jgi:hypothetical protein
MEGLRKAALTLANLHEQDRAWLMGRLEAGERARVAPLLAELNELGLSLDPQSLAQVIEGKAGGRGEGRRDEARPLASAAPRAVAEALEGEPDWLIALVLRGRSGPWRTEVLALLGAERRVRIEKLGRTAPEVGPRMMATMLSAIEARLT